MTASLSPSLAWALAATLGVAGWLAGQGDDDPAVAEAIAPARPTATPATAPAAAATTAARSADAAPPPPDRLAAWAPPSALALSAWSAPPPPPAAPRAATPPPAPPAFPYRWIGRLDDGARSTALLAGPLRTVGVREGDVLDGRWRFDRVSAQGLDLTWLPTGQMLTVPAR